MGECLILKSGSGVHTDDATANSNHILNGYTAYVNDEKIVGLIKNRDPITSSLNPGEIYTALEGYHDGTDKISVSSLSSNTSGTAQNGWILSGYNAWVNGNLLTGSMTNRGSQSWNLAANGTQIIWSGFYDGTGKVSQSLTTSSGGTWTPTTSNKTLVNASTWVSGAWYVAGASTLIAANIKKDVSIFGVKGTFTGWVDSSLYPIKNGVIQNGFTAPITSFIWKAEVNSGTYNNTNIPLTFSSSNGQWTCPSHYVYSYSKKIYGYKGNTSDKVAFPGAKPRSITVNYGMWVQKQVGQNDGSIQYEPHVTIWYTRTKISTGVTSTSWKTGYNGSLKVTSTEIKSADVTKTGTVTITPDEFSNTSTYTYTYAGYYSFGVSVTVGDNYGGDVSFSTNARFFITNFVINI